MSMKKYNESDMLFEDTATKTYYKIDECWTYQQIKKKVKIADFLMLDHEPRSNERLYVIEAKKTIPRVENQDRHHEYLEEIRLKLINGFALGISLSLKRHYHAENQFPDRLHKIDLSRVKLTLVLIVKNIPTKEGLIPIRDKLLTMLDPFLKICVVERKLPVLVLNEEMAKSYRFISEVPMD
jgi:hypothetical protein